ncbi:MAG: 4-(cytidine 5'-diphospho)-2-C-methyl-D-erythritol kinase [Burkholderiales bacterium]
MTGAAAPLVLAAPAKVNLFLHVTGRRADGYHLLESVFACVDLADTVTLAARADGAILRTHDVPGVPPDTDLAVRAARALQAAAGVRRGVALAVDKRIPMGAGLGGGSSDAATVLLGLNRLWGLDWPRARLAELGATLGADVPFFVGGEPAMVRGIGEKVAPVTLPAQWIALAIPRCHVRTADVFAAAELTRDTPSAKIDVFSDGYGRNDLADVTAARFPEVAEALVALRTAWPAARMSGSGACVFAACPTEDDARRALVALPAGVDRRLCRTLARHPLAGFAR